MSLRQQSTAKHSETQRSVSRQQRVPPARRLALHGCRCAPALVRACHAHLLAASWRCAGVLLCEMCALDWLRVVSAVVTGGKGGRAASAACIFWFRPRARPRPSCGRRAQRAASVRLAPRKRVLASHHPREGMRGSRSRDRAKLRDSALDGDDDDGVCGTRERTRWTIVDGARGSRPGASATHASSVAVCAREVPRQLHAGCGR